ncbi:MAG: bacteriocin family protein [Candidatus Tectomicrobia bacterium]|uniref:Bacteriocin family protein n=1 Tax=Tectimicrobiota bacterium TaxID=2528274 RepID=A0A933GLT9_UNCTE|nr:bacteriocin family protein [Candidatus Tectomicrobia bacterium]
MVNFSMHTENPLSDEEMTRLTQIIIETARRQLVGRRCVEIYGPLGAGVQSVQLDTFLGQDVGNVDLLGDIDTHPVHSESRKTLQIPIIFKDFELYWRDIETSREFKIPLDFSVGAGASAFCALKEDDMIFNGERNLQYPGLLNVEGRLRYPLGDWDIDGQSFQDTVKATELLLTHGHYGPYAMVSGPKLFSKMHRIYRDSGVLEIEHIRNIVTAGVYQCSVIRDDMAVILSTGRQNFDIAMAQDLRVAYLGAQKMNHPYRVFECFVLRIKRPQAICTLEQS